MLFCEQFSTLSIVSSNAILLWYEFFYDFATVGSASDLKRLNRADNSRFSPQFCPTLRGRNFVGECPSQS